MRKDSQQAEKPPRRTRRKPSKPTPDFPLFPHATGRWAKKIRGRFSFFGPWEDPWGALGRYQRQKDALLAGYEPPRAVRNGYAVSSGRAPPNPAQADAVVVSALTVRDLVNHFLTAKQRRLESGEMGRRSFSDYHFAAKRLVKFFGRDRPVSSLGSADFGRFKAQMAKTLGPVSIGNEIGRIRSIFKYGYDAELLDHPVRFGPEFRKPPKRALRLARKKQGSKMFEAAEVRTLLESAKPQMKAMILLGINCGLGNSDLATLPRSALQLDNRLIEFPRPKTGIDRRAMLWPETVAALREVLRLRPATKRPEDEGLVFITKQGRAWLRVTEPKVPVQEGRRAVVTDAVSLEFGKLMRRTGVYRAGRGFYGLRHSFRTVADETKDRRAVDLMMGHEDGQDMATRYVEQISDERLRTVSEYVRNWLSPKDRSPCKQAVGGS